MLKNLQEKYGFPEDGTPSRLRQDIDGFCDWSAAPINLERGVQYPHAVQDATLQGYKKSLRAFAGFVRMYHHLEEEKLTLEVYKDPNLVANFVSYLIARGVGRGRLQGHLSLARKVNDYLAAGDDVPAMEKRHAKDMDAWLGKLETQIRSAVPDSIPAGPGLPAGDKVITWATTLASNAVKEVVRCKRDHGYLVHSVALRVHDALLVSLVTGAHVPPCRLSLIKSWQTIKATELFGCQHACMRRDCPGNWLELVEEGEGDEEGDDEQEGQLWDGLRVRSHVNHRPKQEKGGAFQPISFLFPKGDLTKLLVTHMLEGHALLVLEQYPTPPHLFLGKQGKDISHSDSLFTQYWGDIVSKCNVARCEE